MATQVLRSWRELSRREQADLGKPPVYKARTMRLELWSDKNSAGICRFKEDAVQIRVRKREYLWLPLIMTEHHELRYLKDWRRGKARIGEITISLFRDRANVYVPFKREVEAKPTEGVCGIDINERSVDPCVLKPGERPKHVKLYTSKLAATAHSMELKQTAIQKKLDVLPLRPLQEARLKRKYRRRRRNRTTQMLHEISKQVAGILAGERVELVFEDLTGIRRSMRSKRKSESDRALRRDMRRRLNQWPFRRLQLYVKYKATREGYRTYYLPREQVRGTSSTCPLCGSKKRPNGHLFSCSVCGFVGDRHYVAAYNIAARWLTKNVGSHVPPEWCQMKPMVKVAAPPMRPSVKAQDRSVGRTVRCLRAFPGTQKKDGLGSRPRGDSPRE